MPSCISLRYWRALLVYHPGRACLVSLPMISCSLLQNQNTNHSDTSNFHQCWSWVCFGQELICVRMKIGFSEKTKGAFLRNPCKTPLTIGYNYHKCIRVDTPKKKAKIKAVIYRITPARYRKLKYGVVRQMGLGRRWLFLKRNADFSVVVCGHWENTAPLAQAVYVWRGFPRWRLVSLRGQLLAGYLYCYNKICNISQPRPADKGWMSNVECWT